MKIAYITAQAPWGRGETFIIDEMLALKKAGANLLIIPRNPTKEVFHNEALCLLQNALYLPLISASMLLSVFTDIILHRPNIFFQLLWCIIVNSNSVANLVKNLIVFPKGLYIAKIVSVKEVHHIHAHWSTTTSTIAYIVSQLTGIPWSFTVHSGMILWNNMIEEKVKTATFVRAISEHRRKDVIGIAGSKYKDKIIVLHMGIFVPPLEMVIPKALKHPSSNIVGCVGHLDKIKGHEYLIKSFDVLRQQGHDYKCLIIGDGKERRRLQILIKHLKLEDKVKLEGAIPHSKVIDLLSKQMIDVLVLPSVTIPLERREEGIPVVLMEAMANGIPVISTDTGAIPELLKNGAGMLIPERDPKILAETIKKVLTDRYLREKLICNGYKKVNAEFNIELIAHNLYAYFTDFTGVEVIK